jgi:hypothetical protein
MSEYHKINYIHIRYIDVAIQIDDFKMNLKGISADWINLADDRVRFLSVANAAMKVRDLVMAERFLNA